jgi:hypothetical protein
VRIGSASHRRGAEGARRRALRGAIGLALLVRVAVFAYAAIWPLTNEQGAAVSPMLASSSIDLAHYQRMRELYFGDPEAAVAALGAVFAGQSAAIWGQAMFSGPLFPLLLELFDFGPGSTLPLALLYLAIGCALAAAWLIWLDRQGLHPAWLLLFALLPNPVWFMLNVSTDLLFAAAAALFYFAYFSGPPSARRLAVCALLAALALTIRPNAVALALFLLVDATWKAGDRRAHRILLVGLAAILVPAAAFYGPYLYTFIVSSTEKPLYFGRSQAEFLAGVFPMLPEYLDRALSLACLAAAKVLCLVGLRPSAGDTATPLVLLRAAPGLILLPGLLWGLLRADASHRLLIALFAAPVLAGASQDRYMLPLLPVLYMFGCGVWGRALARLRLAAAARLTAS